MRGQAASSADDPGAGAHGYAGLPGAQVGPNGGASLAEAGAGRAIGSIRHLLAGNA